MAYIDKKTAIEKVIEALNPSAIKAIQAKTAIEKIPNADVVEVVRCKNCKHFGRDMGYGKHDCKKYEMPYCLENDYCSHGERKSENE